MYHPFLHDYLLERAELFDFIGLPLDLYTDPARSALLDPGLMRLSRVIATKPCAWHGSALSLGAVPSDGEPAFPAYTLHSIRRLLEMVPGAPYTEVIGFRVPGQGGVHAMPFTPDSARWIARRQAEAQDALGIPVQLSLPKRSRGAAPSGRETAAFLALLSVHGATGFVVDTADVGLAVDDGIVPLAHISALSVSSDDPAAWDRLSTLAEHVKPRTVILCRDRQLFPLDTIDRDLRRARSLIAEPQASTAPLPLPGRLDAAPPYPAVPLKEGAASAEWWQNWRKQVDDMHKAQQIAAFLSRGPTPGPSWHA
jgi:uncharacterized protein (UPF0276 family)